MINLDSLNLSHALDINAVTNWCSEMYDQRFASYFQSQRSLYKRLNSKRCPITDEELEDVLTRLPLDLFSVAEVLSQFKISQEVVKLKIKEKRADAVKTSSEPTATKRQEAAALAVSEDELLYTAYSTVIERVDREISFSRELIMSAKKIWDARRKTEESNPVKEVSTSEAELPDYTRQSQTKSYIR